jgi:hypothetical protein
LLMTDPAHSQTTDGKTDLVLLYGVQFVDARISIDVLSNGCTDESYFSVKVEPSADSFQLSIIQLKPDRCRMRPHIISVTLDIPAAAKPDDAKFQLLNKLAPPGARLRFNR